jgi:hypothetical protein
MSGCGPCGTSATAVAWFHLCGCVLILTKRILLRGAQDALKKLTNEELPDFYNITLERPKDDPDGYDVMYVEAAFKVRP